MKLFFKTAFALVVTSVFSFSRLDANAQIQPAPAFDAKQLSALPTHGWLTNGGNLWNQRYTPLDQINLQNLGALKAEWRTHLNGSGLGPQYSGQSEVLAYDGVLYVSTGENDVFAVDVETGNPLWVYQADIDPDKVVLCCGWVNRGVAIGDGKVFLGQVDAKLVALDQKTGEVAWEIQAEDYARNYAITAAPRYYDNKVIVGFAGGEYGIRGRIKAYDADDGKLIWTFYTVPGPGEFGHDTWPDYNDSWKTGGAPIWQTPAIDPQLGLVIFSTGNPAPDQNGAVREGDNLFSTSVVALDVETGEYKWHFQQTRHDIWDYDSSSPVVLFDVEKDGVVRKGAAQISKSGYLFILDRVTGEPLVGVDYKQVPQLAEQFTATAQPIPVGDEIIPHYIETAPEGWELINQGRTYTPFGLEPVLYAPLAGANWMPSSYDPKTGHLFVCANYTAGGASMREMDDQNLQPSLDRMWMGGNWNFPRDIPSYGVFAAVDVRSNTIVWRRHWDNRCSAGSTATAGDLIFIGRNDGRFTALDKNTGREVWSFLTAASIHPSASIFEHNGQQKIAVLSAGSLFAGSGQDDSVWLFSLSGKMEPLPPKVQTTGPVNPSGLEAPDREPDLARGEKIYNSICASCHGDDGQGGHVGGAAFTSELTIDYIMTVANFGRGKMPTFSLSYSREELHDVASYILREVVE